MELDRDSWVAQFVTELVVRSSPAVPAKFARVVAFQWWLTHRNQDPGKVARNWRDGRRVPPSR